MECMICLEEDACVFQMPCCGGSIHRVCITAWIKTRGRCPVCETPLLEKLGDFEFAVANDIERHGNDLSEIFRRILQSMRSKSTVWFGFRQVPFIKSGKYISMIYKKREYNAKYTILEVYRVPSRICPGETIRYKVLLEFDITNRMCLDLKHLQFQ